MSSGILGPLAPILTVVMFVSVLAYPVAQVYVLFRRRGWSLALSALPILPMGLLMVYTAGQFRLESNLAPLLLLLASPLAVLGLWLAGFLRR